MTEELTFDTKLFFYSTKIIPLSGGRYLIVSIDSANWIVLDNQLELEIFEKLKEFSIGSVIENYGEANEKVFKTIQTVLAKIFSREFAGQSSLPIINRIEGYKMLNLYVTNACNLRCPHCFMNAGTFATKELSTDEIKKILQDFKDCGGTNITFTGGEPMMRKDFMELLNYAKKIGLSITVLTNALLWKDKNIEEAACLIDEIQISIDGVDELTNSKIRGTGNFQKAYITAKKFAELGVRLSIATTLDRTVLEDNIISGYLKLKQGIEEIAKNEVIFKFSKKILPGRNKSLSNEENELYEKKISEIEEKIKPNVKLENFMLGHGPNVVTRNCGIGGLSISSDGHVFFCNRVHEIDDNGYIFDKPMSDWLRMGAEINESTSVDKVRPCNSCFLKNICSGGCRIDDFNNKGRNLNSNSSWIQISCNEERKSKLINKMVKMFDYFYEFSQQ